MKDVIKTVSAVFMVACIFSCSNNTESKTEDQILSSSNQKSEVQINKAVFDEMIQSLPQPIEIANIITKVNMPFSKEMLIPSDNADQFTDKYSQALAFGGYGVDLGYINLHDKKIYTLEYLEAIKTLSEKLKVQQFFDFQTLFDLTKNRHNADSLIRISTKNFNKIDAFLREENRGELSILIMIGAWTEGIYMFGQLYRKDANEEILKRIGEQKIVFENISLILEKLNKLDYFNKLKTDISEIKKCYDKVQISYKYNKPETKEVNGELVIIDKTETTVDITKENASDIIKSVETFRDKYLVIKK